MAVNLPPPDPASLHPVPGVELGVAMAGVRKADRKDLLVMRFAEGAAVAGVFTQNRFCAAPVILAKRNLEEGDVRCQFEACVKRCRRACRETPSA